MSMGFTLPSAVRESYLCADGQEAESAAGCSEGLFFGLTLLPLEDVLEEWRFWREVDDDPNTGANPRLREVMQSIPAGWVRREYSCKGWIPLVADKAGNYLGVDMNPGEDGSPGQVIVFGRDFDTKVVMWRGDGPGGWGKWLSSFVDDLESGEGYDLGSTNDGSEGSEDSVGYESYFFDGVGGGQGDSGGDTGTGGLRMTGEYKGWNVLEAWADRSVRRWQEAGLFTDESYPPWEKGKAPERVSMDRLQMGASGSGSGAEVPIPVFSQAPQETSALAPAPLGNVTNKTQPQSRPAVPTISVSKPPAPLPVDLPTPQPIDSPTSDARPSDIETGDGMMMREIDLNQSSISTTPLTRPPVLLDNLTGSTSTAASIARVSSPPSRTLTASPETIRSPTSTVSASPMLDFLASPEQVVPPTLPNTTNDLIDAAKDEADSPVLVHADDAEITEAPIRLVGGGGVSGVVDDSIQNDVVFVEDPQSTELTPVRSNDSTSTVVAKHEKKKSISSSLKNFGPLGGGKRKKDSVSLKVDA